MTVSEPAADTWPVLQVQWQELAIRNCPGIRPRNGVSGNPSKKPPKCMTLHSVRKSFVSRTPPHQLWIAIQFKNQRSLQASWPWSTGVRLRPMVCCCAENDKRQGAGSTICDASTGRGGAVSRLSALGRVPAIAVVQPMWRVNRRLLPVHAESGFRTVDNPRAHLVNSVRLSPTASLSALIQVQF